jgi:hypothetical protein
LFNQTLIAASKDKANSCSSKMPHRKHSSPRSHRLSSRDRKQNSSSSSSKHGKEHDRRQKKRKPGSKCAQIKQLKALLASLRQEGALQTSEFINTLLRNPACRTAAQSSATPESAYMAIANQALNNAARNRESIENSRIASDGSARSWIGNKWYRLKRGVSNNSGKVATAVLIAACVALYYMYGAEAIQNATGQAFTSVKEYAAYLAAQTGEYLTKLRNYFSGSPPPSAQQDVVQVSPGQQLSNEYALAASSTDSTIATDYFWNEYEKLPSSDEKLKYLSVNGPNFIKVGAQAKARAQLPNKDNINGGASRNTTVARQARQSHRLAHKVESPNLKRVLRKSSPSVSPRRKAKPVTNKPAENASKSSKSPNSTRRNSNSTKSSHGMTLRKRT